MIFSSLTTVNVPINTVNLSINKKFTSFFSTREIVSLQLVSKKHNFILKKIFFPDMENIFKEFANLLQKYLFRENEKNFLLHEFLNIKQIEEILDFYPVTKNFFLRSVYSTHGIYLLKHRIFTKEEFIAMDSYKLAIVARREYAIPLAQRTLKKEDFHKEVEESESDFPSSCKLPLQRQRANSEVVGLPKTRKQPIKFYHDDLYIYERT
jgi:hypothetical protein